MPLSSTHLPSNLPSNVKLSRILLQQEIRTLLVSPALWAMLIILSLLVGYSFIQAVDLFSKASQTALAYPDLATGMNPLEGIFVPTFGAYYLVETLLLPFVIIRLLGQDKHNNNLKLLLQLPLSPLALNGIKLAAMGVVWLLMLIAALSTLSFWYFLGGVIYVPEMLTLILGHSLYALTIVCIALFATTISSTLATAAMICLSATLGSWVLDFASSGQEGWLGALSHLSLTALLRQFESGLLSSVSVMAFLALSLLFFISASSLLHSGRSLSQRLKTLSISISVLAVLFIAAIQIPFYQDVTENQKHSFNPADVRALQHMSQPLNITVHLSKEDGRLYDLEHEVLMKLRRMVPDLKIIFADTQSIGSLGASGADTYGLIEYDYNNKHDQSYSNSPLEILPILHALADQKVQPDALPAYTGHPLLANASQSQWWFYLGLPLLFLLSAYISRQTKLPCLSLLRKFYHAD